MRELTVNEVELVNGAVSDDALYGAAMAVALFGLGVLAANPVGLAVGGICLFGGMSLAGSGLAGWIGTW